MLLFLLNEIDCETLITNKDLDSLILLLFFIEEL